MRIRDQTRDDDAGVLVVGKEVNPEWPAPTLGELRHAIASKPAQAYPRRLVAEVDGRIVGTARWHRRLFVADERTWWGMVMVSPDYRNRGIGSALYDRLLADVRDRDGGQIKSDVRSDVPEAMTFVQKRGFRPTGNEDRHSRLEVRTARLERCREAANRMAAHDIRIATLEELGVDDDEVLRRLHRLDIETTRDVPMSDEFTDMPFEEWAKHLLEAPGLVPASMWIALDGERQVGLAFLARQGECSGVNWFTAVDREYRGKGIARALKLRTVEWARQNGIDWIYTGNDVSNQPMLAINVEMGYEPLPRGIEVVKGLN